MTPRSAFRRSRPFSSSMISLLVILAASVAAYAQPGKIYYVATTGSDSNPGSQAEPWLTISHAAKVARAGATVYVMGGVYNEIVNFPHSGTPPCTDHLSKLSRTDGRPGRDRTESFWYAGTDHDCRQPKLSHHQRI